MNAKEKVAAWLAALLVSGGGAVVIAQAFISEKEGLALTAYQDGARVWTVCYGKTENVTRQTQMSREDCDAWLASEIGKRMAFVQQQVPVSLPDTRLAALTSFCFNVGLAPCAKSTAFRLIGQGETEKGCAALLAWRFITRDGRKVDCSKPNPWCAGLWRRRQEEAALCLMEVENG